jgi:GntR family transcriptional regulator
MTKYETIIEDVRKKIKTGIYQPNQKLPTETELGATYQASRITVKKAIDQLVLEGLVFKRRGAGTFVKERAEVGRTTHENGVFQTLDKSKIHSMVVSFEVIPAGDMIAEKLGIKADDYVYYFIRYRYNDTGWRALDVVYMPINLIRGFKQEILLHSVYEYIEKTLGYRIHSAHRVIRAVLPDEYDKKYLETGDTDPILLIEQIGYLDNGVPFEYSIQHHRGDEFELETVSVR